MSNKVFVRGLLGTMLLVLISAFALKVAWPNWPIKTICHVCEEQIWGWQDSEYRTFPTRQPLGGAFVFVSMTDIAHTLCEGETKNPLKVEIQATSKPEVY